MWAIYGILGVSDNLELDHMGASLTHRGAIHTSWSVEPGLHLGSNYVNGSSNTLSPPDVPVVYDGPIDISEEMRSLLKVEDRKHDTAKMLYELYRKMGPGGFRHVRAPFAVALWDDRKKTLVLATDQLGIKMLYYASDALGRSFFASEYKAFLALESFLAEADRDAIQHIHRTKYAMAGRTCLAGVKPVLKGCWVEIDKSGTRWGRYMDIKVDIAHRSESEHTQLLADNILKATKRITSRFDKFGIALSGGIDSVVVAAAARRDALEKEIHSFTIGIDDRNDSLLEAKKVAEFFKTVHHEIIINANDLPGLMKKTLWHMEEPTGREERILYYRAALEAAKHVPLIMTGNNVENIYGGMPRHLVAYTAFRLPVLRKPLSEFYDYTQSGTIPQSIVGKVLVASYFKGDVLPETNVIGAQWSPPKSNLERNSSQPFNEYLKAGLLSGGSNNYATGKLFNGTSISVISPFWDLDLIESAFQIPDRLKIKGLNQKYVLKRALRNLLPDHLMNRKKDYMRISNDVGFCDCLENIANEVLSLDAVSERGLFKPDDICRLKSRRRGGLYTMQEFYNLWSLVMVEMWCQIFLDNRGKKDIFDVI